MLYERGTHDRSILALNGDGLPYGVLLRSHHRARAVTRALSRRRRPGEWRSPFEDGLGSDGGAATKCAELSGEIGAQGINLDSKSVETIPQICDDFVTVRVRLVVSHRRGERRAESCCALEILEVSDEPKVLVEVLVVTEDGPEDLFEFITKIAG